jgi:hypothetical protein
VAHYPFHRSSPTFFRSPESVSAADRFRIRNQSTGGVDSTRFRGVSAGSVLDTGKQEETNKDFRQFISFGGSPGELRNPRIRFAPGNKSYDALGRIPDYNQRIRILTHKDVGFTDGEARILAQSLPALPGSTLSTQQMYLRGGLSVGIGAALAPFLAVPTFGSLAAGAVAKKAGAPVPAQIAAEVIGGGLGLGMLARRAPTLASRLFPKAGPELLQGQAGQALALEGIGSATALGRGTVGSSSTVAQKLTELVKTSKPRRKLLEETYSMERGRRAAEASEILRQFPDDARAGYAAAQRSLAGPLAREGAKRFDEVESALSPDDVKHLFGQIQNKFAPMGDAFFYKGLNTQNALSKVLRGEVPGRKEIELLENMFGSELAKAVSNAGTGLGAKGLDLLVSTFGLPRAFKSSIDLSAMLRQGLVLSTGHPKRWGQAAWQSIKAFAKEDSAQHVDDYINAHDSGRTVIRAREAGLFLARRSGDVLEQAEEAFMTRWANLLPGMKQSQRAYVTFLNKLRFDVFADGLAKVTRDGKKLTHQQLEEWALFINRATGRGGLGPLEGKQIPGILNTMLYSARLASSRMTLPMSANQAIPAVLRMPGRHPLGGLIAKDIASFAGSLIGILGLIKLSGQADINVDPRSSDFAKIRIGEAARIDILGGFQQMVRLVAQLATNERRVLDSEEIVDLDRMQALRQYIRSKSNPSVGFGWSVATGTTFIGEDVDLSKADEKTFGLLYKELFEPMFTGDLREAIREEGLTGAAIAMPGLIGAGVTTFRSTNMQRNDLLRSEKYRVDALGRPIPENSPDAIPGERFDPNNPNRRVTHWSDLERKGKSRLRQEEDFRFVDEQFTRDAVSENIREIQKKDLEQQRNRDDMFLAGTMGQDGYSGRYWIQELHAAETRKAGRRDIVDLIQNRDRKNVSLDEKALAEYYEISEKYQDDIYGGFDSESDREEKDEFLASLPQARRDYVLRNLYPNATPLQDEYNKFRSLVADVGWHSLHKETSIYKEFRDMPEIYQEYTNAKRRGTDRQWLVRNPLKAILVEMIDESVEMQQDALLSTNLALDAGAAKWWDRVPKTRQAQAEIMRGQKPEFQFLHLVKGTGGRLTHKEVTALLASGITSLEELARATTTELLDIFSMASRTAERPRGVNYRSNTLIRWGLQSQASTILSILDKE